MEQLADYGHESGIGVVARGQKGDEIAVKLQMPFVLLFRGGDEEIIEVQGLVAVLPEEFRELHLTEQVVKALKGGFEVGVRVQVCYDVAAQDVAVGSDSSLQYSRGSLDIHVHVGEGHLAYIQTRGINCGLKSLVVEAAVGRNAGTVQA